MKVTIEQAFARFLEFYNKAKKNSEIKSPAAWAWYKTGEWIHRYEKKECNNV